MIGRRIFLLALVASVFLTVACGQKPTASFKSTDVTGAAIGGALSLTDHQGKPRSLDDFRGKVVVLFFGFTHCPDVCPTTMAELAVTLKQLGEQAKDVQVLFVTVDPERDTQAVLAQYVPAFNPTFIGLYGTAGQTRTVADRFKIFYEKAKSASTTPGNYTVDHSAGSYIFDKTGALRLFVSYGAGSGVFLHDIQVLLAQ